MEILDEIRKRNRVKFSSRRRDEKYPLPTRIDSPTRIDTSTLNPERNGGWTLIISDHKEFIIPTRPMCIWMHTTSSTLSSLSPLSPLSGDQTFFTEKVSSPLPEKFKSKFSLIFIDCKEDYDIIPYLCEGGEVVSSRPIDGMHRTGTRYFLKYAISKDDIISRKINPRGKVVWFVNGDVKRDITDFYTTDDPASEYIKLTSYSPNKLEN